jgi:hypothetical protein
MVIGINPWKLALHLSTRVGQQILFITNPQVTFCIT